MGLFSKLFGAKAEKEAMDVLKNITQAAVDAQKEQPIRQPTCEDMQTEFP